MTLSPALAAARKCLETCTPLKGDCGRLCGSACCQAPAGETRGMLLFPGEEALYAGRAGFHVLPCAQGRLLVCGGACRRAERPLSCRLFPLLPVMRRGGIVVEMDRRGRGTCPLCLQGPEALDPAFRAAVAQAGRLLLEDAVQAAFLRSLTAEQDEWARLTRQWGGKA